MGGCGDGSSRGRRSGVRPEYGLGNDGGAGALAIGEDPFDVERIWSKVYRGTIYYGRRGVAVQVLSGLDIACHDIIGKAIGRPIHKLLGGAYRERVVAYASTLFRPTPDDMKRACEFYLHRGFRAIKFGWADFGHDRKRDVARVAAVREVVGPDVALMVDAGWRMDSSPFELIETLRALEPYDPYWFEDFLPPECYAGYARVKESGVRTRIAAGEQEATVWGFRQLIEQGKVDVIQPDLSRCGGLTQARRIVWEAERAAVDVCAHAWLTDLLTAASLHLSACLPRSLYLEYNVSENTMLRDIIRNPIELASDGTMRVPDGPGLGIDIDEKAVQRYRVL